ncbi:MAG: hypothetical protein AAB698_01310 [Patescibacteria group bacterium]
MDKKISLPEIIIMVMIVGGADLFGIIAGLAFSVPVIGQILIFASFFIAISVWLIVQFWLIMRGVSGWWYGGGSVIDIISGGALPLQSPTLWLTLYLANKSESKGVLGAVEKLSKGKIK